nr:hypothetical protein [Fodinicola feengrottensis]
MSPISIMPAPSDRVRERAGNRLTERQPDQESGQRQLHRRLARAQLVLNGRERRQVEIDGQRPQDGDRPQQQHQPRRVVGRSP